MLLILPQLLPIPWKITAHDGVKWKFAAKFYINAAKFHKEIVQTLKSDKDATLKEAFHDNADLAGVVVWPFMCADWDVPTRMQHIADHFKTTRQLGKPFNFDSDQGVVLLDNHSALPEVSIVLDEPIWFLREGKAVLSLFFGQFRAFSLAFSLRTNADGSIDAVIGAIQGRSKADILDTYRSFTKAANGLRPRDFLIEVAKMVFREINVSRIYAVSEESRVNKHAYFDNQANTVASVNYDEVWKDRGAERASESFWELSVESNRKDLSEIKSKKRSLYRKRYAMLDDIQLKLSQGLKQAKPNYIQEADE